LEINLNEIFGIKKFDIIIGNPPYNENLTSVGAKPLYNKFIEYYIDKCKLLSFIVPSRWFSGGKGLDKFRTMMINRSDILYIKHFNDATKIFGNSVDIKGGVNYFLIDKEYNGLCDYNGSKVKFNNFDIILDAKYYDIVNKLLDYDKITKYYISQDYYKIQTNDTRLIDQPQSGDCIQETHENKKEYLKCYVSQQKGFTKYIDKNEIKKTTTNYKVITARAAFGANSSFGNTFIGYPNEIHTKSYISFNLNSEKESKSLLSYMKCKLPNFMLSIRKSSQDISESTCKWIPLPPLNKEWNDEEIYKYFKLSEDEIKLVKETKIIGYKN
jgi:site-specific DNA-methyltransferase (adenine-specific)